MKAVVAIDSLKGSLSSMEAGNAIAEGIYRADAEAKVEVRPLADGGEGPVDALVRGRTGSVPRVGGTGPVGAPGGGGGRPQKCLRDAQPPPGVSEGALLCFRRSSIALDQLDEGAAAVPDKQHMVAVHGQLMGDLYPIGGKPRLDRIQVGHAEGDVLRTHGL